MLHAARIRAAVGLRGNGKLAHALRFARFFAPTWSAVAAADGAGRERARARRAARRSHPSVGIQRRVCKRGYRNRRCNTGSGEKANYLQRKLHVLNEQLAAQYVLIPRPTQPTTRFTKRGRIHLQHWQPAAVRSAAAATPPPTAVSQPNFFSFFSTRLFFAHTSGGVSFPVPSRVTVSAAVTAASVE